VATVIAVLGAGTRSTDAPVGLRRVLARTALVLGLTTVLVLGPATPAAAATTTGVAGVGLSVAQWATTPVGLVVAAAIGVGALAILLWRLGAQARAHVAQFVLR